MPRTFALAPTVKDLAIPQPPALIIEPVTAEEESAVELELIAAEKLAVLFTLRTFNVDVPVTFKLPPTVALLSTAIPPEMIIAPEETLVESAVLDNYTKPENMAEEKVEVPVKMVPPETVKFPDMFMLAPIPTPPATVNAPTEEDVEFVVFKIAKVPAELIADTSVTSPDMVAVPAMFMFPPMFTDFAKAAPPDEITDPVVTLEESYVLVNMTFPEADNEEEIVNPADNEREPAIDRLPLIETLLIIPTPPEICNAPDEILVESIWLATNKEPSEVIVPATTMFELKAPIPVTVTLPPTVIDLATAIPPAVVRLPELAFEESTLFPSVKLPPQYTLLTTAIPPLTMTAPVESEVESVVPVKLMAPDPVNPPEETILPLNEAVEFTFKPPPMKSDFATPTPPAKTTLPVDGLEEFEF
ncbi:hypothetical protein BDK51DRAFT_46599 [Blyttiomyces helicus]|uniref:Uncharacterized protein n=1 Tax=Blyttiomyces helicus TaxID=388810 RepID=A0A4P9WQ56_9FUNG|nr:hypothetical protein BDK51DRAFT_46599 [Blyttiomyces helicus]|eukprot:RKO94505.1 hypothetical protein BDK51DRAFT_46599 [Blyttiomyces helicus]